MKKNIWHECLRYAIYYAPRGRERLLMLGESIGQRYLASSDRLVGIIGESGVGKSSVIKGMFAGVELTNDDEGVNIRPSPTGEYASSSRKSLPVPPPPQPVPHVHRRRSDSRTSASNFP